MADIEITCASCGTEFSGHRMRRYCDVCKAARDLLAAPKPVKAARKPKPPKPQTEVPKPDTHPDQPPPWPNQPPKNELRDPAFRTDDGTWRAHTTSDSVYAEIPRDELERMLREAQLRAQVAEAQVEAVEDETTIDADLAGFQTGPRDSTRYVNSRGRKTVMARFEPDLYSHEQGLRRMMAESGPRGDRIPFLEEPEGGWRLIQLPTAPHFHGNGFDLLAFSEGRLTVGERRYARKGFRRIRQAVCLQWNCWNPVRRWGDVCDAVSKIGDNRPLTHRQLVLGDARDTVFTGITTAFELSGKAG